MVTHDLKVENFKASSLTGVLSTLPADLTFPILPISKEVISQYSQERACLLTFEVETPAVEVILGSTCQTSANCANSNYIKVTSNLLHSHGGTLYKLKERSIAGTEDTCLFQNLRLLNLLILQQPIRMCRLPLWCLKVLTSYHPRHLPSL